MKLFGLDFNKVFTSEVKTVDFLISPVQIEKFGGLEKLGTCVNELETNLPKGVMNTSLFGGKEPHIRIMYFIKHIDTKEISNWLGKKGIPFIRK